jgi:hypothetical protein
MWFSFKENHMQLTEAATLDRKTGEPTCPGVLWRDLQFRGPLWKRGILFSNRIVISPAPACRGTGACAVERSVVFL